MFDIFCRWVHSDCASLSGPPEEKCICVLCKENPDEVPIESEVSSTQVDEKADLEVPMELGMIFSVLFFKSVLCWFLIGLYNQISILRVSCDKD